MKSRRAVRVLAPLAFVLAAATSAIAHADMLVSKNVMVTASSAPDVETLGIASAGTLSVTVSDLGWPQVLKSLSFAITDGTKVLKSMVGAGLLAYDVTGPMTLFANVYAVPTASTGAYHLDVSFAPAVPAVPLPAAAWLLVSGVGGLWALRRKSAAVKNTVIQTA